MSRLEFVLQSIRFAREYTNDLLRDAPPEDWLRMPEGVTHITWQVGHLAIVQYRLALVRIRGARPEDAAFIPDSYQELFGKGSVPRPDEAMYPSPAEIREVFDAVHKQVLEETPWLDDARLDEPTDRPHPAFNDKFGALCWSAGHELLHAGQIGLLRRLMGHKPLR